MRHLDRRIGMSIFAKCTRADCEHCSAHPPTAMEMVEAVKGFPSPTPSVDFPGHFMSMIEALVAPREPNCEHLPKFQEKGLGRCQIDGCKYVFTSLADQTDHRRKVHPSR